MTFRPLLLSGVLLSAAVAWSASAPPPVQEFDSLSLTVVAHSQEGDGEVRLRAEVDGALERLVVVDPLGRLVWAVDARDPGGLGVEDLTLQSGDRDLPTLRADFPAGTYLVRGRLVDGGLARGLVELSHELPARWRLISPRSGDEVPASDVVIEWEPDSSAYDYEIHLEEDDADGVVELKVPEGQTDFRVPEELVRPGHEYTLDLSAGHENGNRLIVESSFSTR